MASIEDVVLNTGKGFASGFTSVADPVGATVASIDYSFAGIGPSDKIRGNNTLYNHIHKGVYGDFERNHDLATGYLPRAVGNVLGGLSGIGLGYLLWTAVSPIAALAVPVAAGVYGLARGIEKYVHDWSKGEKIGERYEKGSFLDGFKFGWHSQTSYLASVGQTWESGLTGRGYDNSHIKGSTATHAAKGARRNFSSMAGSFVGRVVGEVANVFSLAIMPIYKTVRDLIRTAEGTGPGKEYRPSYSVAAAS